MGIFGHSHALRAIVLAWGMACLGPAPDLAAGTLVPSESPEATGGSAEPFGLFASTLSFGDLREKWLGVERKLDDERVQLALCDGDRDRCVSPAALQFLAIVDNAKAREGRARLGEINRAINLAIRPMSDLAQHGAIDVWSSPLVTFASGAGDCEDYAIAKFAALRHAGISPDDLRIVIMRDTIRGEDLAVQLVGGEPINLPGGRLARVRYAPEELRISKSRPRCAQEQTSRRPVVDRCCKATPHGRVGSRVRPLSRI